MIRCLLIMVCCFFSSFQVKADISLPSVDPSMSVDGDDGGEDITEFSGSAPAIAHFIANIKDVGDYIALYEWTIYEDGNKSTPEVTRYVEDIDYTFKTSGTWYISLSVNFVNGADTIKYETETPFMVLISESKLELPNAFSPNGDGQNDIYKVKDTHESIVNFHGYIFNRWGKRLFEWTNIDEGWDGTVGGKPVKDGVYFCLIKATGADGIKYEIKRDVNVLRKYYEGSTTP